ncbi:Hypothetical protein TPAS_1692 [Trichococcus pasteurii]|uniref:Uncharacterized protein n=1 Tax=Trichococcus pasteurii TaxID=43064 RepID=A0A1W1IG67_9LACT|nr:hypothetical protein SAMN04488086_11741 [Trichococcus pasteurii]SLM52012.1 Hypothetical protein TPAS_1692 [Trichococcus pasteurii]SSB92893.1 Hypothetical protein TPAS_1692 [Trichococcus pasteurii]
MFFWSIRKCPENELLAISLADSRIHSQNRNNGQLNLSNLFRFPNDGPNIKKNVKKHIKYIKSIESTVLCKKKQLYYDLS